MSLLVVSTHENRYKQEFARNYSETKKKTTGKKPKSCGVSELGQSHRAWAKLV
jgi:hypothetical protein